MRATTLLALSLSLLSLSPSFSTTSRAPAGGGPDAAPNANLTRAGVLRDGVLTVALEATHAVWHPDGDSLPGRDVAAFAEAGRRPLVPGPLLRVPAGTLVHLTVRNSLGGDTLAFHVPPEVRGAAEPSDADSMVVAPGEKREMTFTASVPGNYMYRASANDSLSRALSIAGQLVGALVVDSSGVATANDRVLVLHLSTDSVTRSGVPSGRGLVFAINGRSWPHTERLHGTVGDTLRWRVINAGDEVHPMHLHGFYYRVDEFTGALAPPPEREPGRMVVTQRMAAFTAMSITWVPERAGNWLFHCHFQLHVAARTQPSGGAGPSANAAHENHAMVGMSGLVIGIMVAPRRGDRAERPAVPRRWLRLVATRDSAFPDSAPSMRFVLEDRASKGRVTDAGPGFSPPIVLERGEPVSIMVVNRLREPTAVHWHGIELESYYDGVAGFTGNGARLSPIIAPRDSFEARFTPPRAGTFIYHSHVSEPVQHRAGLIGALIVLDPSAKAAAPAGDHTFFLKSARAGRNAVPVIDVNGQPNPDTVVLHTGRPARLRFISLALVNPNATVWLAARADSALGNPPDSLVARWRPLAKDGADLPPVAREPRLARQLVSMGETYDFEFTPAAPGRLQLEVRGAGRRGAPLARVPVRVE